MTSFKDFSLRHCKSPDEFQLRINSRTGQIIDGRATPNSIRWGVEYGLGWSGIKTEKIIAVLKKDDTAAKKFEDNVAATTARAQKSRKDEEITLRIIDLDTRVEYLMKLTRCMKMSVLMNAYAKRKGVQRNSLRFLLNGKGINHEDNPESMPCLLVVVVKCILG